MFCGKWFHRQECQTIQQQSKLFTICHLRKDPTRLPTKRSHPTETPIASDSGANVDIRAHLLVQFVLVVAAFTLAGNHPVPKNKIVQTKSEPFTFCHLFEQRSNKTSGTATPTQRNANRNEFRCNCRFLSGFRGAVCL